MEDLNVSGIYCIEHVDSGRKYIGSSMDIEGRWARHSRDLLAKRHHSVKLQRVFNKYGPDSLRFYIVQLCTEENLLPIEQIYLDCFKPELNTALFAASPHKGRKHTEESKKKMSKALKGKPHSEEHNKNMGLSKVGNKNWEGKKHSDETKAKMSAWQKGVKKSPESVEKQRQTWAAKKLARLESENQK